MNPPQSNPAAGVLLQLPEAVELCHCLVAHVAEAARIRAFFIKGPASVLQGLRRPKTSTDVDVFVAPDDVDTLIQDLEKRGWKQRPGLTMEEVVPRHSYTMYHDLWPNSIDIHFRFPGMDAPPSQCFDAMWSLRSTVQLANRRLVVPAVELHICIIALHALREPWEPANQRDLDYLTGTERPDVARIIDVAKRTGCLASLRPFLEKLPGIDPSFVWPQESTEWKNRLDSETAGAAWIRHLMEAPVRKRFIIVAQALFPSKDALLSLDLHADVSLRGRAIAYTHRWGRFARAVPALIGHAVAGRAATGSAVASLPAGSRDGTNAVAGTAEEPSDGSPADANSVIRR